MTALDYAIQMERDGEKYYWAQAERLQGTLLEPVFRRLAADEREHAHLLEQHGRKLAYELNESQVYNEFQSVFAGHADFAAAWKSEPGQLDVYTEALRIEEDSIKLYEDMLAQAEDEAEQRLFRFLLEQERLHKRVFEDIVEHLRKAEQWVESAEFGRTEEY